MTGNKKSRGIRNNIPGNIRWGDEWQGLIPKSQRTDKSFCQFTSSEYGIRAMIVILHNYQSKYGLRTITGMIIKRWAPPNENDTQAYIDSVAQATSTGVNEPIDLTDSRKLFSLLKPSFNTKTAPNLTDSMFSLALSIWLARNRCRIDEKNLSGWSPFSCHSGSSAGVLSTITIKL